MGWLGFAVCLLDDGCHCLPSLFISFIPFVFPDSFMFYNAIMNLWPWILTVYSARLPRGFSSDNFLLVKDIQRIPSAWPPLFLWLHPPTTFLCSVSPDDGSYNLVTRGLFYFTYLPMQQDCCMCAAQHARQLRTLHRKIITGRYNIRCQQVCSGRHLRCGLHRRFFSCSL